VDTAAAPPSAPTSAPPGQIRPPTAVPQPPPAAYYLPGQSAPYGYAQPAYYWPAPPTNPKVAHSPWRWTVVIACVLVIAIFGSAGALVALADLTGADRREVTWHAPGLALAAPPPLDASASDWNNWARTAVDQSVKDQAAALVAGDEDRYLAAADQDNDDLVADLERRFTVLRDMGIGQWGQEVAATPRSIGEKSWRADIRISYCFGDPTCRVNTVVVTSEWAFRNDRLRLTVLNPATAREIGPRPWETSELVVAKGTRVVVAAARRNNYRLQDAVAAADKAAKVADTLAKWDPPPSRYVIFLAGAADWSSWYSYEQPAWAGGVFVKETNNEVVINSPATPRLALESLLTHELTHVATMGGRPHDITTNTWWLVEGVADYATMIGKPLNQYDALKPTQTFVRGRWDGDPVVRPPAYNASTDEAAGRYGVAFLAVRRISDVYGQDKMLNFWGKVVHDDLTLEAASTQALGKAWATVKADCAQYVRNAVG
jgi:hypothetical protein